MASEGLDRESIENFILETNFGVIPIELWISEEKEGRDPFTGYSEKEARKAKRKFRKLKRKSFVLKGSSGREAWRRIDRFLRMKEDL